MSESGLEAEPTGTRERFLQLQHQHFVQCLREARFVGAVVVIAGFVICGLCISLGYVAPIDRPETPDLLLGIPSWVVYGLVIPWLVLILVTWWFAWFMLKDDEPYMDFPKDGQADA